MPAETDVVPIDGPTRLAEAIRRSADPALLRRVAAARHEHRQLEPSMKPAVGASVDRDGRVTFHPTPNVADADRDALRAASAGATALIVATRYSVSDHPNPGTRGDALRRAGVLIAGLDAAELSRLAVGLGGPPSAVGAPRIADPRGRDAPGALPEDHGLSGATFDLVFTRPDRSQVVVPAGLSLDAEAGQGLRGPRATFVRLEPGVGLAAERSREVLLDLNAGMPQPWARRDPAAAAVARLAATDEPARDGSVRLWVTREEADATAGRHSPGVGKRRGDDLRLLSYAVSQPAYSVDGAIVGRSAGRLGAAALSDGFGSGRHRGLRLDPVRLEALAAVGGEGVVEAIHRVSGENRDRAVARREAEAARDRPPARAGGVGVGD